MLKMLSGLSPLLTKIFTRTKEDLLMKIEMKARSATRLRKVD